MHHLTAHQEVADTVTLARATQFADVLRDFTELVDKGHGRVEHRRHWVISDPDILRWLQEDHDWPGLGAIGASNAERRIDERRTTETRSYLLNRP